MLGTVKNYDHKKKFGFIVDEDGEYRFFSFTNVEGKVILQPGDIVRFEPYANTRGPAATSIRIVGKQGDPNLLGMGNEIFLDELSNWKMEAKLEDNERYFYHIGVVDLITKGNLCYVIGRKGTGKTAICEHLTRKSISNYFARKLTFKNFPFNDLYKFENNNFTYPNQYITLWKYIIYSEIAQLMVQNPRIDSFIRSKLENIYFNDIEKSLQRKISEWTGREFGLDVLGSGAKLAISRDFSQNENPWIMRVEILEEILLSYLDDSTYLIAFDELDEDYKNLTEGDINTKYSSLVTSLFKAVQDIKSVFRSGPYNVLPVIFLRDDIYAQLQDADRTKWGDLSYDLDWSTDQLKQLIAFRISRGLNQTGEILSFEESWIKLFSPQPIKTSDRKVTVFNYILGTTMLRPRDLIRYIRDSARGAKDKGIAVVDANMLHDIEKKYSTYLRGEIEDEIGPILPHINEILNLIARMGKQNFRHTEFAKAYNNSENKLDNTKYDYNYVLSTLFNFSVIGYNNRDGNIIFRYLSKYAQYNPKSSFSVHRGLYKSLQL